MLGICHLTYIPMRSESTSKSEQVSQLIYGECYEVLKEEGDWYWIKNLFDQYQGYINKTQFHPIDSIPQNQKIINQAFVPTNQLFLPCGAMVQGEHEKARLITDDLGNAFDVCNLALQFKLTTYLWGGRTFMGIDCSGLVQVIFKACGYNLPRDAKDQVNAGIQIKLENAAASDVAFFKNAAGKISHTGILLDKNKIIHAHGMVRIDTFDSQGIYNSERQEYSHQLASIRRIIG
jgi:gamma-D-glutamyl-L-lysine dipeptidyl-peptidase